MKKISLLFVTLIGSTYGFFIKPHATQLMSSRIVVTELKAISIKPLGESHAVDLDRAKDCAENFGKCSVQEIEQLKTNLHKERLQHFAIEGVSVLQPSKETSNHLALEQELELQLALLKQHNTADTSLFPEPMEALPHLKHNDTHSSIFHKPTPVEILAIEESVFEENTLETVMFCLVMAALMVLPQLGIVN